MSKKERESSRTERAAAIQREQASRERNRKILVVVAVLVVLGAIVTAGVLLSGGGEKAAAGPASLPKAGASGQSLVVGANPDAKVKVVVYEDFLCPYCREFESASRKFLHADASDGKVVVQYRPFHLLPDDYSTRALTAWAAVLQKGTPKQALAFHDLLFENQPYEQAADKPGVKELTALAKQAGVTDQAVLDAIGKENTAFVDAANAAAAKDDVQGTPTVIVNGQVLQGSASDQADQLQQMIANS